MADIPLTMQTVSSSSQDDTTQTSASSSSMPSIPLGSEKGVFFEKKAEEYADPNMSEKPAIDELLRPSETSSSSGGQSANDPQNSKSIFQSPVVVDLRKRLAPVFFSKPKRTIASNADAITQLAADTEQKFITSIKTAHGNK